jgi:hypothetical protein
MTNVLSSALKIAREDALVTSTNTLAQQDPSVSIKEVKIQTQIVAGKYGALKSSTVRNVDLFRLQTLRACGSSTDYNKAMLDGLKEVQDGIASFEPGGQPRLVEPVADFFRQVDLAIQDPSNHSIKSICVESGVRISKTLNQAAESCYDAMAKSELQIQEELQRLNNAISELAYINFEIGQEHALGHDTSVLFDKRDALVGEISASMAIETPRYGHDGTVLISSSGFVLIQKGEFASFEFAPQDAASLKDGIAMNKIFIKKMIYYGKDSSGTVEGKFFDRKDFFDPKVGAKIKAGKLRGLLDLHQVHLPSYIGTIDTISVNLTEQINRVHNTGSTYPGRAEILGISKKMATSRTTWGGTATIGLVQSTDGRVVKTGSTLAAPLKLNLGKLAEVSESGVLTPLMIVDEINNHFGIRHGDALGMGQQGADNKFLLHEVAAVVSRSDDSQIRFDFEGFNSSDFGTDFEIVGVTAPVGASILGTLPDKARIERGEKTRTFQTVTLDKGGLGGNQNITVKFRVRGDNGVVKEGSLNFTINFNDAIKAGTRISPELPGGGANGDFAVRAIDRANYITAAFVDGEGDDVTGDKEGVISLRVNDQDHRIVLQDGDSQTSLWVDGFGAVKRGFGHFFGLNNFFSASETKGKYALDMRVRSDIESDPTLFSSTRLVSPASRRVSVSKGTVQASARIALNSVANFAPGEAITVNGRTFTFGAAPGNIPLTGNFNDDFTALLGRLNSDRDLSGILEFTRDGDALVMTAKTAGASGNDITYNSTLTGGAAGLSNLAGGASSDMEADLPELGMQTVLGYTDLYSEMLRIDKSSKFLTSQHLSYGFGSITALTTMACNSMIGRFENIKSTLKINQTMLDKVTSEYKSDFGFDDNDQTARIMQISDLMRLIAYSQSLLRDSDNEIIRMLTR